MTISEAIARLAQALPVDAPDLWESLQQAASNEELRSLQEAVAPADVPSDLIELLSWRNGGSRSGPWWPILESGHLLGATEAVEHYRWLCENTEEWQWRRSWLPVAHEGWNQCGIELSGEYRGLIIDGSFPDPPRPVAPSLVALLHASCAVMEAGLRHEQRTQTTDGTHARVKQRALIAPIYEFYGPMPDQLPAA